MRRPNTFLIAGYALVVILASCASISRVSFREDVKPIFDEKCISCHQPDTGYGYLKGRLDLSTYKSLRKGSIYGPVIIPGDSQRSVLNKLVEGRLGLKMPMAHPLSDRDIDTLRRWVDEGAQNN